MDTTIANQVVKSKSFSFNFIEKINNIILKEKANSIGISIALIMLGTGIASITAALAVTNSFFILMVATILAMGANVTAISQRKFKTIVWAFTINISVNLLLILYLISSF